MALPAELVLSISWCILFTYLDLCEGGKHGDAPLHGHGDGGVDAPREGDVDEGEEIG